MPKQYKEQMKKTHAPPQSCPQINLHRCEVGSQFTMYSRCVNAAVWIFSSLQQSNSGFADIFTLAG
jgi:hypothetical protein